MSLKTKLQDAIEKYADAILTEDADKAAPAWNEVLRLIALIPEPTPITPLTEQQLKDNFPGYKP